MFVSSGHLCLNWTGNSKRYSNICWKAHPVFLKIITDGCGFIYPFHPFSKKSELFNIIHIIHLNPSKTGKQNLLLEKTVREKEKGRNRKE